MRAHFQTTAVRSRSTTIQAEPTDFEELRQAVEQAEQPERTPAGEPVVVRRLSTGRSEGAGYIDQSLFVELVARFAPLLLSGDEDVWLAWEINPPRLAS